MRPLDLVDHLARTRHSEFAVEALCNAGAITGPTHSSLGHDWVAGLVCDELKPADWLCPYYRSHSWMIARSRSPRAFLQAIVSSVNAMHLSLPQHHITASNAYVAQHVPIAAGQAWGLRRSSAIQNGESAIVVASVGEGAFASGLVMETLCMANRNNAPLVVCVEDNGLQNYGTTTASATPTPASIAAAASVDCAEFFPSAAIDPVQHELIAAHLADVRNHSKPSVLWFHVALEHPHSIGPGGSTVVATGLKRPSPVVCPGQLLEQLVSAGIERSVVLDRFSAHGSKIEGLSKKICPAVEGWRDRWF